MMKHFVMVVPLLLSSCSMRTFYPTLGGVVGAAAGGAIGGPLAAGAAGGAGVLVGELAKGNEDLKQATATISAMSRGDIEALVNQAAGQNKGFVEETMDSLYGFIKICLVGVILWTLVPLAYARFIHKKQNGNSKKTES